MELLPTSGTFADSLITLLPFTIELAVIATLALLPRTLLSRTMIAGRCGAEIFADVAFKLDFGCGSDCPFIGQAVASTQQEQCETTRRSF